MNSPQKSARSFGSLVSASPSEQQCFKVAIHVTKQSINCIEVPMDAEASSFIAKRAKLSESTQYFGISNSGVKVGLLSDLVRSCIDVNGAKGEIEPFLVVMSLIESPKSLLDLPPASLSWNTSGSLNSVLPRALRLNHVVTSVFQTSFLPNEWTDEAESFRSFSESLVEIKTFFDAHFSGCDFDTTSQTLCQAAFSSMVTICTGSKSDETSLEPYMTHFGLDEQEALSQLSCLREWPSYLHQLYTLGWTLFLRDRSCILASLAQDNDELEKITKKIASSASDQFSQDYIRQWSLRTVNRMAIGFQRARITQENVKKWKSVPSSLQIWVMRASEAVRLAKLCKYAKYAAKQWSHAYITINSALKTVESFEREYGVYTPDSLLRMMYKQVYHATGDESHLERLENKRRSSNHFPFLSIHLDPNQVTPSLPGSQFDLPSLSSETPESSFVEEQSSHFIPILASDPLNLAELSDREFSQLRRMKRELNELARENLRLKESLQRTKIDLPLDSVVSSEIPSPRAFSGFGDGEPSDHKIQKPLSSSPSSILIFSPMSSFCDPLSFPLSPPPAHGSKPMDEVPNEDSGMMLRTIPHESEPGSYQPPHAFPLQFGQLSPSKDNNTLNMLWSKLQQRDKEIFELRFDLEASQHKAERVTRQRNQLEKQLQEALESKMKAEEEAKEWQEEVQNLETTHQQSQNLISNLSRDRTIRERIQAALEKKIETLEQEIHQLDADAKSSISLWKKALDEEKQLVTKLTRVAEFEKQCADNLRAEAARMKSS